MSISVEEFARRTQLTAEESAALREIISDPEIVKMAQEIAERCFIPDEYQAPPEYPESDKLARAWFAAAYFGAEAAEKHYQRLGFPRETLLETMTDLPIWLRNCKRNYGVYGLRQARDWQVMLFRGAVTRHGRLECNTKHLFQFDDLVDESGRVILKKGDPVINLHIPEDGRMDMKSCSVSLRRMSNFFAEYRSDYEWKGFICESWLLDPQLKPMLPENSNIVKFQSLGYCYDVGHYDGTVFRIFGSADPQKIENPTSLQRKAAEFLEAGGKFGSGGFFIPRKNAEAVDFELERLIRD